ncbi:MAG: Mur ligase family protein [Bryobacteraceae bacterium]
MPARKASGLWCRRLAGLQRRPQQRFPLRELGKVLRNPLGRRRLVVQLVHRCWPAIFRLAALCRRTLLYRPFFVAVVGSYGKTTATRVITHVLGRELHHRAAANGIGRVPYAVLRARPWDAAAVVEVGIDCQGQMAAIAEMMQPDCAVVMSVGIEHHSSFGSLQVTRDEKADMVRVLPASGLAVLNGDDPNVLWMAGETRARVVTFGFGEDSQVRASDAELDWPLGMRFHLHAGGQVCDARIQLLGRHMIYPALAAVAVGLDRGVPLDLVLARLASITPSPGRLSVHKLASGAFVLRDDAKSALETVHAALDVLEEVPAGRKIAVMGPMTEPPPHSRQFYRDLAARLAGIAGLVVCVDSYRNYGPGLRKAGMSHDAIVDAGADLGETIGLLRETLGPGDVVLLKGRGRQKLERVAMALDGRQVGCTTAYCPARSAHCPICPMLEKGWTGCRPVACP